MWNFQEHLFWRASANCCFCTLILKNISDISEICNKKISILTFAKNFTYLWRTLAYQIVSDTNCYHKSSILVCSISIQHINVILRFLWSQKPSDKANSGVTNSGLYMSYAVLETPSTSSMMVIDLTFLYLQLIKM